MKKSKQTREQERLRRVRQESAALYRYPLGLLTVIDLFAQARGKRAKKA